VLDCITPQNDLQKDGRAPRGARGLKRILLRRNALRLVSRPARGAWIETVFVGSHGVDVFVAPRAGRVD